MRIAAGLLLLFGAFAAAWFWQEELLAGIERELDSRAGLPGEDELGEPTPGWGRVVVGNPSGAEAVEPPPPPIEEPPVDPGPPPPEYPSIVVERGQRLWTLATERYGAVGPDLVTRLGLFNGLPDPDRLQEGMLLQFPPREVLDAIPLDPDR